MKTENRKNRKSEDVDESSWGIPLSLGSLAMSLQTLVREEVKNTKILLVLQVVEKYDAVMPKDYGDVKTDASFLTSYSVLPYKTHAFLQLRFSSVQVL